jgi:hypothetical protein
MRHIQTPHTAIQRPSRGGSPKGGKAGRGDDRHLILISRQQGEHRRSRGASNWHLWSNSRIQRNTNRLVKWLQTRRGEWWSSEGVTAEILTCQVHHSQNATTTPVAATPSCGHPPTNWEGLPTEWGLRVGRRSLTKTSQEMTTSLPADGNTIGGSSECRIPPSDALRREEAPKEGGPIMATPSI